MKLERNDRFKYFYPEQKAVYNIPEEGVELDNKPILLLIKENQMNKEAWGGTI